MKAPFPSPLGDARGVAASIMAGPKLDPIRAAIRSFNRRLPRPGFIAKRYDASLRGVPLVVEVEEPPPYALAINGAPAEEPRLMGVFPQSKRGDLYDLFSPEDKAALLALLTKKGD